MPPLACRRAWRALRGAVTVALLLVARSGVSAPRPGELAVLRLSFVGDLMAHDVNLAMADYGAIYRGVTDLLIWDDLTFANLELPVDETRPTAGYPRFNAHRDYLREAAAAGVDVFSLANNHALDQGEGGVRETLRSLAGVSVQVARPLHHSGTRPAPEEPFAPTVVHVRGIRVGFLAVTQFMNQGRQSPLVWCADYGDPAAASHLLAEVHRWSRELDVLVVSYHGGRELAALPGADRLSFFRALVDAGAHIVYGHHPHVFQTPTVVETAAGTRLIMPSMGNFISGMPWTEVADNPYGGRADTGESVVLRADLLCTAAGSSVIRVLSTPIVTYRSVTGALVVGKLRDVAEGRADVDPTWIPYYRARLAMLQARLGPAADAGSAPR